MSPDRVRALNEATVRLIRQEYERATVPWLLGYSGGKDSSALLKLVYEALRGCAVPERPVTVVYCDTGVEIPTVRDLVRGTLDALVEEARADGVALSVVVAEPPLEDRYFVKVIGRGYPPPTNKFRWCTDRLRIAPVRRALRAAGGDDCVVLLGVRRGESPGRDRTLERHRAEGRAEGRAQGHYFHQRGSRQRGSEAAAIFSPIVNYSLQDVWATLARLEHPASVSSSRLSALYRDASGECPIIRDPRGTPCGTGRFGCWTCTVVRKDRAVTSMVEEGHASLRPLLEWRNWLASVRDLPAYRCRWRRNGAPGPGPLTLRARREALRRLIQAQQRSGHPLVSDPELRAIRRLWAADRRSPRYRE